MDTKSNDSAWDSRVTLPTIYVVYVLTALFSILVFSFSVVDDPYGVSRDTTRLVHLVSGALLVSTLLCLVIITRLVITATTNTAANAPRQTRQALLITLMTTMIMVTSIFMLAQWLNNL